MAKEWSAHTGTQALIKACLRHERRAEETFYKQYFASAYRTCNRYLSQHEDILSVVNEGFLKVFQNLKKYDAKQGEVDAWVHRIMVNTAIDQIRKDKRKWQIRSEELTERDSLNHSFNEGFYDMEADEILSMIKRLPTVTRTVFNFIAIEEYSHKEVAQKLNISEGTSRWHLSEARKQLKQHIRHQEKALDEAKKY